MRNLVVLEHLLLGQDFFPAVDAGQIRMHVNAPVGTRIEETGLIFSRVQEEIAYARRLIADHAWPFIDMTRRSIEEAAAAIITHFNDRIMGVTPVEAQ